MKVTTKMSKKGRVEVNNEVRKEASSEDLEDKRVNVVKAPTFLPLQSNQVSSPIIGDAFTPSHPAAKNVNLNTGAFSFSTHV